MTRRLRYSPPIPADITLTYGLGSQVDLTATDIVCNQTGTRFEAHTPAGRFTLYSHLVGEYNVYNILAATATALSMDIPTEQIQAGVASLQGIIGRGEQVDMGANPSGSSSTSHTRPMPCAIVCWPHAR